MKTKFTAISLNCFGSPLSLNWKSRFKLINIQLRKMSPDIVCFQEVFTQQQKRLLLDELSESYNIFSERFTFITHGGLLTLIKKTIKVNDCMFRKFVNQGSYFTLALTDRIAGKGMQILNLEIKGIRYTLVNTHMLCLYGKNINDLNAHLDQTKQLISELKKFTNNLLVVGDLNINPTDVGILKIKEELFVEEYLSVDEISVKSSNLNRNVFLNLFNFSNSYRTDYVFLSKNIDCLKQEIIFKEHFKHKGLDYNLSDHYGIKTEFNI